MAASHPVARLAAASFHLPVNPNTGARVAHYERAAPLNAVAAAALEDEDDDQVVRPERAAVMQGQDSGRVWVRAGGVALAAPRLVAGGKTQYHVQILATGDSGPLPSCAATENTKDGDVGRS